MDTSKIIRWSGLASILAGVLYAAAAAIHPAAEDAAAILTPAWVPAHMLGAVSAICMLFGFAGLYARMAEKAGWAGFTGFVLVFIGSSLLMAEEFQSASIAPLVAAQAPAIIAASANSSSALLFGVVFLVGFSLGFLLFGIAVMRSSVLPRGSGLLLIAGLLLTFGGQAAHSIGVIAAVVLGLGLAWMGAALWSEKRPQPEVGALLANERVL